MKTLRTTSTLTNILSGVVLLLLTVSCGKESDSIFGEYEFSEWELTTCGSIDNNQRGVLDQNGVCLTWPDDGSQFCAKRSFILNQDSTFVYDFLSQEFDSNGNTVDENKFQIKGIFTYTGTQLSLINDQTNKAHRRMLIDAAGNFIYITTSANECDTREVFRKK